MRTTSASIAVLGVATALSLCGCSSDGGSVPAPDGSTGGSGITAACAVENPAAGRTALPPKVDVGTAKATVGVVLAGTTGAGRSSDTDAELLTEALVDGGVTADVVNARGDKQRFVSSARRMLDAGVKVLIIDAVDNASGVAVERAADLAGAEVIDYDRLNLGGTARYYVSYDAEDTGRLQAQTMVDCLAQQGVIDPRVLILDGGTDVDNNAVLLDRGAHEVLDPLVAAGRATIEGESSVKGWTIADAGPTFKVALDAAGGQADAVLAANDEIADAVIGVLTEDRLAGAVVVAGQGSGTEGLRNIVTGQQSMTVFQDARAEADAAARLAIALVAGKHPSAAAFHLVRFTDPTSPNREVQAFLLPGRVVTRANVTEVVDSGALTTAEICAGITDQCAALGLR